MSVKQNVCRASCLLSPPATHREAHCRLDVRKGAQGLHGGHPAAAQALQSVLWGERVTPRARDTGGVRARATSHAYLSTSTGPWHLITTM